MAVVIVRPDFSKAIDGAPSDSSMNFGIMRRLYAADGRTLNDGRVDDVARINHSAYYTKSKFVSVVQDLILDDLRKFAEGDGSVEFPEDVYAADYMIGELNSDDQILHYVTIEITDPLSYDEFKDDIKFTIQNELYKGDINGNDTAGLTRLYEIYFKTPSIPETALTP